MGEEALLFDADCGFCKWALRQVLARDREDRLRPVALQDPRADELLANVPAERRMESWHLVDGDGRVYSGGAAIAPLLDLLRPGTPLARLARRFPRATDRGYRWVASNRALFGRLTRRWQ